MRIFGLTDKGLVRKENQDDFRHFFIEGGNILCAVLCDGMGGAQAGSIASRMAVEAFESHAAASLDSSSESADMKRVLVEAVRYANIKVYDRSFSDFSCMGMGCTMVAAAIHDSGCIISNVGDSRAYIIRGGLIRQISRDHSLVEEMLRKGEISLEEARNHPQKNIITRAIGVESSVGCDIFELNLRIGDRLLLCSDGLSNMLSDEDILEISRENPDIEAACASLMERALCMGAPDNVTVLIAEV